MRNTFFITIMLFFCTAHASAQFRTITKEKSLEHRSSINSQIIEEESEGQNIIQEESSEEDSRKYETLPERVDYDLKNAKYRYAKIRRRKPRSIKETPPITEEPVSTVTFNQYYHSLPELTIPNLMAEIKKNGILYPDVVLAQAILETGWFKSSVCRNKHNLFGLRNPRTGNYYSFNHWTESVKAYYTKVQYRYKGGNYLLWLDKIGYAETKTYIRSIVRVMKSLKFKI